MTFTPYRPMMAHQEEAFARFCDASEFALFWEMRCGKSKTTLDIFRYRVERGDLDALVVIAFPNGVHRVLIDELPKEFPPEFLARTRALAWASGKMATRSAKERLVALLEHDGPVVLTFNCEAILTKSALDYLRKFFAKCRVMLVADESSWMSNWSARTQKMLAIGRAKSAVVKVILDGTPVDEGVTDILYPTNFLRHGLLGFTSMASFKNRYLAYEQEEIAPGVFVRKKGHNYRTNADYDIVVGTQNLEELTAKLSTFGSRVRRADVTDAPAKIYQSRVFQLTERQRQVYDRLRDEYLIELRGGPMPVAHQLTRLMKLQMVTRNFHPPTSFGVLCAPCQSTGYLESGEECVACGGLGATVESTEMEVIDPNHNPAAEALTAELIATKGPVVVWCRFKQDVLEAVAAARRARSTTIAQFDGSVKEQDREATYQGFRCGTVDVICATVSSGLSRGRDLTRAVALIYYSNSFSLRTRRQSEDRAEALARETSTDIVDLMAEDTVDGHIVKLLRDKMSISQRILNDPPGNWL